MHIAPKPPGLSGLLWGMWLGSVVNSAPAVSHNTLYVGVDNNLDAVDLTGWSLSGDIAYGFAPGTMMPAGAYWVVVSNAAGAVSSSPALLSQP